MYTYVVIDDEELIRKGTIKKLAPLSDTVTCIGEADNGLTGIEIVKELHPDFVILDMQMPEMNGMELLPYFSEHYPEMPLIVISGYRDFDYIKQAISSNAIEYLLKPFSKETIQNTVKQALERLKNRSHIETQLMNSEREKERAYYEVDIQLVSNLIMGNHVTSTVLTSQKLKVVNDIHNLILLTMHFSRPVEDQIVQGWLEEHGFGDLALYLSGPKSPNLGFMILFLPVNRPVSSEKHVTEILDDLIPWIQRQDVEVLAGISRPHESISELAVAYEETAQALNQKILSDQEKNRFFYQQDFEPKMTDWSDMEEFLFRIDAGMTNEVRRMTRELFSWYVTREKFSLADAKFHCHMLSEQCRLILNDYLQTQSTKGKPSGMQNVVNHLFTLQELEEYYLQFFTNLASMIEPMTVYAVDDIIEKIQIYMGRNYQKNLTQELISSFFYINRSYLSTLFKQKTGQNFTDYLNDIRIYHAKEMLLRTDKKMYSIARAVGYDNVKYFFRIFKKREGVTPEQYRLKK